MLAIDVAAVEITTMVLPTFPQLPALDRLTVTDPDPVSVEYHFFGFRRLMTLFLGTRLYREPTTKSNRTIILNAIEYVVFPGVVNAETRNRVLDVIDRCDCPHFLLLFRDAKCQFRGLYAYYPDTEEVYKIYGTGPKQVTQNMYESFFK